MRQSSSRTAMHLDFAIGDALVEPRVHGNKGPGCIVPRPFVRPDKQKP
jgi:hypothetical protein